tara:strand:+ start:1895 stop:2785 length:891 start_codon:yes stop_codon:yes gene_type:complete
MKTIVLSFLLLTELAVANTLTLEHPEFDWVTLKRMKESGASGIATSFKPDSENEAYRYAAPFVSLYSNSDEIEAKYLIANYTENPITFQLVCLMDYAVVQCVPKDKRRITINSKTEDIIPVSVKTSMSSSHDFVIIGVAEGEERNDVSMRTSINPHFGKKTIEEYHDPQSVGESPIKARELYLSDDTNGELVNQNTLVNPQFLHIANDDDARDVYLFSICINSNKEPVVIDQLYMHTSPNSLSTLKLEEGGLACQYVQYGRIYNPYRELEKSGKIIEEITVDMSMKYEIKGKAVIK